MAKTYHIGVIPGDGIGPEVVREGLKVLRTLMAKENFDCQFVEYPYSGVHYLRTKELVPERVIAEWADLDAIYLGAIGHPGVEPGLVERSVIMGLRMGLDLYVNLRPIKLLADHLCPLKGKTVADVDFVVVRENTEDVYAGVGGVFRRGTPDEIAIAEMVFTRKGTERVIRYAYEYAQNRRRLSSEPPPKVTMVDKANAIRAQDLWTRTFAEAGQDYPDVIQEHLYVDACCMLMVKNPEAFDVIVTTNLFGDILTDLGAMIQGGIGTAASGNIHPGKTGMFEPVHGSAPDIAGQGIANPIGAILSIGMMLDFLGEQSAARQVEAVVTDLLSTKKIPTVGIDSGLSTSEIGELVTAGINAYELNFSGRESYMGQGG